MKIQENKYQRGAKAPKDSGQKSSSSGQNPVIGFENPSVNQKGDSIRNAKAERLLESLKMQGGEEGTVAEFNSSFQLSQSHLNYTAEKSARGSKEQDTSNVSRGLYRQAVTEQINQGQNSPRKHDDSIISDEEAGSRSPASGGQESPTKRKVMFLNENEEISGNFDYSEDHLETMAKEIQQMKAAREERDRKRAQEKAAMTEKPSPKEQELDQFQQAMTISRKQSQKNMEGLNDIGLIDHRAIQNASPNGESPSSQKAKIKEMKRKMQKQATMLVDDEICEKEKQKMHLTNEFNEMSMLQILKQGLQNEVAQQIKSQLMEGQNYRQKFKKSGSPTKVKVGDRDEDSQNSTQSGNPGSSTFDSEQSFEILDFFRYFEIVEMLSHKCFVARCDKLRGKKFFLKQIPQQSLDLATKLESIQKGRNEENKKVYSTLNEEFPQTNFSLIDPWTKMQPQLPAQHCIQCYGICKIKERYYFVCDLVQDNIYMPFQVAQQSLLDQEKEDLFESEFGGDIKTETMELQDKIGQLKKVASQKQSGINLSRSALKLNKSVISSYSDESQQIEQMPIQEDKTSKNVYQLIQSMKLGNLSAMKDIPKFYIQSILQYIMQVSLGFIHAHHQNLVHGHFNLSKVIAQKVCAATGCKASHAPAGAGGAPATAESLSGRARTDSQKHKHMEESMANYQYLLTNFEPWNIDMMIENFENDKCNHFYRALKYSRLSLTRTDYILIQKILDLQSFGNSIIEMMVGQCQEEITINDKDIQKHLHQISSSDATKKIAEQVVNQQVSSRRNNGTDAPGGPSLNSEKDSIDQQIEARALGDAKNIQEQLQSGEKDVQELIKQEQTAKESKNVKSITGGIPFDSLPLIWGKQKQTHAILNILNKCFGPYDFNHNISNTDTVQTFKEIYKIAKDTFDDFSSDNTKKSTDQPTLDREIPIQENYPHLNIEKLNLRMKSSVINNRNTLTYLTITEDTEVDFREQVLKTLYSNFEKAIDLSKNNTVAHLNKILLEWQLGMVRDDQVLSYLKGQIKDQDPISAELMFKLFTKNVIGSSVDETEMTEDLREIQKQIDASSFLSKFMFDHRDFEDLKKNANNEREAASRLMFRKVTSMLRQPSVNMSKVIKQSNLPKTNMSIPVPKLEPQSIFFSNNDNYITVIGKTELIIISTKSGQPVYKLSLPNWKSSEYINKFGYPVTESAVDGLEAATHHFHHEKVEGKDQFVIHEEDAEDKADEYESSCSHEDEEGGQSSSVLSNLIPSQERRSKQNRSHLVTQRMEGGDREISASARKYQTNKDASGQFEKRHFSEQIRETEATKMSSRMGPYQSTNQISDNMQNIGSQLIQSPGESALSLNQMNQIKNINQQSGDIVGVGQINYQLTDSEQVNQTQKLRSSVTTSRLDNSKSRTITNNIGNLNSSSALAMSESDENLDSPSNHSQSILSLRTFSQKNVMPEAIAPAEHSAGMLTEEAQREKCLIQQQHPSVWTASLVKTGKMLALFDKAQQVRNRHYKYAGNKTELIFVYNIVKNRQSSIWVLDMRTLLNDEEVLSFGFDDFDFGDATMQSSIITVQAKNLYLYIIDYSKHVVITKIQDQRHSLNMKSIFFNNGSLHKRDKMHQISGQVKEFVQHQEKLGNKVLIPKLNEKVIFVQSGSSNLIKIYSIKLRRFVRQFILTHQEIQWEKPPVIINDPDANPDEQVLIPVKPIDDDEEKFENIIPFLLKDANTRCDVPEVATKKKKKLANRKVKMLPFMQTFNHSGKEELVEDIKLFIEDELLGGTKSEADTNANKLALNRTVYSDSKLSKGTVKSNKSSKSAPAAVQDPHKINLLEISPSGKLLVANLGHNIFIRIVNQPDTSGVITDKQINENIQYDTFLPIYTDYDYTYNLKQYAECQNLSMADRGKTHQPKKLIIPKWINLTDNTVIDRMDKLTPGTIDKACNMFRLLLKWTTGSESIKYDKTVELQPFVWLVFNNPSLVFQSNLRPKNRMLKIDLIFKLLRHYPEFEKQAIRVLGFKGIHKFHTFDNPTLSRTHEQIISFQVSTSTKYNYTALFLNRKLQLYDFIKGQLLFEVNFPSAGNYRIKQGMQVEERYQKIMFLEGDNLIAVQDSASSLLLFNVSTQIESYMASQGTSHVNTDITIKIEEPIGEGIDIKDDFNIGAENEGDPKAKAAQSDDSDHAEAENRGTSKIEYSEDIQGIFYGRLDTDIGLMCLIGQKRFTIFDVYDNGSGGVENHLLWDNNYRFDKKCKKIGQIQCADFEKQCLTLVTGSNVGVICIWDLKFKIMLRKFNVHNLNHKTMSEPVNMVRTFFDNKYILSYSVNSKILQLHTVEFLDAPPPPPAKPVVEEVQSPRSKKIGLKKPKATVSPRANKADTGGDKTPNKQEAAEKPADGADQEGGEQKATPIDFLKQFKKKIEAFTGNQEDLVKIETQNVFEFLSEDEREQLGTLSQIKVDREERHVFITFENGYVQAFALVKPDPKIFEETEPKTNRSQKKVESPRPPAAPANAMKSPRGTQLQAGQNLESTLAAAMISLGEDQPVTYAEMKPIYRFGPYGQSQQILIDEHATYMAILGENFKQIVYYIFNWEYQCNMQMKLATTAAQAQKRKTKKIISEKLAGEIQAQIKKANAQQKQKTCNIF